jgi:hypothetical protein
MDGRLLRLSNRASWMKQKLRESGMLSERRYWKYGAWHVRFVITFKRRGNAMLLGFKTRLMIYEDPYTQKKPEGMAELRELYRTNGMESYWRVHFDGDGENEFYERTVVLDDGDQIDCEETESEGD